MSIEGFNNYNNPYYFQSNIGFRANQEKEKDKDKSLIIKKPVEKVENVINKTVDTFVKTDGNEEKQKKYRKAVFLFTVELEKEFDNSDNSFNIMEDDIQF